VKRPPWSYLIVTCAVFITILVGVTAATLAMNRSGGKEVGAPSLGINRHLTLMTPDGSTVLPRQMAAYLFWLHVLS
jgi:hypothetical protein